MLLPSLQNNVPDLKRISESDNLINYDLFFKVSLLPLPTISLEYDSNLR